MWIQHQNRVHPRLRLKCPDKYHHFTPSPIENNFLWITFSIMLFHDIISVSKPFLRTTIVKEVKITLKQNDPFFCLYYVLHAVKSVKAHLHDTIAILADAIVILPYAIACTRHDSCLWFAVIHVYIKLHTPKVIIVYDNRIVYTRKNATDLLQSVAPSGLIQVWYHSCIRLFSPTDCSELTVSGWNSLLGCQGCISLM